jgi:hypothetical protein
MYFYLMTHQWHSHQSKFPLLTHQSISKMPRCIAKKDNGTQCKCNAVIGSSFCGTHQNWGEIMTFGTPSFVEDEWTTSYQPKYVDDPSVGCVGVDDLYDILGR